MHKKNKECFPIYCTNKIRGLNNDKCTLSQVHLHKKIKEKEINTVVSKLNGPSGNDKRAISTGTKLQNKTIINAIINIIKIR